MKGFKQIYVLQFMSQFLLSVNIKIHA